MKNSLQYNPELTGADPRVIMETELLKLQQVLAEVTDSIAKLEERVETLENPK
jgi:hypothetical protein